MSIKNYRGFTFGFRYTKTGSVAVSLRGSYDNWLTLGCVAPRTESLRDFLDDVVASGACNHLAYM